MLGPDELVSLSRLESEVPGCPTHATLHRWITKGFGAHQLKLRAVRVGNLWKTSRVWYDQHIEAVEHSRNPKAASDAATAVCEALGF